MNEIVKVTDKPVKLIDALRCEMAKEARRVSEALDQRSASSSVETLAKTVAAAEVMVATPEYQALVSALQAAFAPASVTDIKRELGMLFACYPAKDVDIGVLVACVWVKVEVRMPGARKVEIRKQTRVFDDFFKVDELIVAHEQHDGTVSSELDDLPRLGYC